MNVIIDFILDHPLLVWRGAVPLFTGALLLSLAIFLSTFRTFDSRRSLRRSLLVFSIVVAIAALGGLFLRLGPLKPFVETVGRFTAMRGAPMPQLRLRRVADASPLDLRQLRGRIVLVNLWATWCAPCRAEMPELVQLSRRYSRDVAVVTVSDEDRNTQIRFAARFGLPADAAVGDVGWNMATFRPFTILVDRAGIVQEFYFSSHTLNFFEQRVHRYL